MPRTLLFALALAPVAVYAGSVGSLTSFTNGTVADATQVNDNFAALVTAVDDNDGRLAALESLGGGGGFVGAPVTALRTTTNGGLSGTQTVLTVPVSMPSTGGPYRALVGYAFRADGGGSTSTSTWVEDDQANDAFAFDHEYSAGGPQNPSAVDLSPTAYVAGSDVTFTVRIGNLSNGTLFADDGLGLGLPGGRAFVQLVSAGAPAEASASWQTKTLSGAVTGTGIVNDLSFANLQPGETYRISGSLGMASSGLMLMSMSLVHDGATIADYRVKTNSEEISHPVDVLFVASADTVDFRVDAVAGNNTSINNETDRTYLRIEHLPGHVETTGY
jgi:hypothetical protein